MKKRKTIFISAALLLAAAILAVCANSVYVYDSKSKISGYVESVQYIENPENDEYIKKLLNAPVSQYEYEFESLYGSLSDDQKAMTYNLNDFNVYKIKAVFENKSNLTASFTMAYVCQTGQFMLAPTNEAYVQVAPGFTESCEYYVFVSKDYTAADIQNYLTQQGTDFNVQFLRKLSGGTFKVNTYYS